MQFSGFFSLEGVKTDTFTSLHCHAQDWEKSDRNLQKGIFLPHIQNIISIRSVCNVQKSMVLIKPLQIASFRAKCRIILLHFVPVYVHTGKLH